MLKRAYAVSLFPTKSHLNAIFKSTIWNFVTLKSYFGNFLLRNNQLNMNLVRKNKSFVKIQNVFIFQGNYKWPIRSMQPFEVVVTFLVSNVLVWVVIAMRVTVITLLCTLRDNCTAAMKVFAAKLTPVIWIQSNNYTRSTRNKFQKRKRARNLACKTLEFCSTSARKWLQFHRKLSKSRWVVMKTCPYKVKSISCRIGVSASKKKLKHCEVNGILFTKNPWEK